MTETDRLEKRLVRLAAQAAHLDELIRVSLEGKGVSDTFRIVSPYTDKWRYTRDRLVQSWLRHGGNARRILEAIEFRLPRGSSGTRIYAPPPQGSEVAQMLQRGRQYREGGATPERLRSVIADSELQAQRAGDPRILRPQLFEYFQRRRDVENEIDRVRDKLSKLEDTEE